MDRLALEKYFDRLWPICRSLTGNGLRESFHILREIMPLELEEVPSGKKVFDWEIPDEWNIHDAYIITPTGQKICDFKKNNLHVLNYSIPQNGEMTFEELKPHLFTRQDLPDAIPYVTSYYKRNWGFCISFNEFQKLPKEGKYKIFIDSDLKPGSLTYGHLLLPGESDREILFSSYLCHPSMANNELSGPLAMAALYQKIAALKKRKYTYRFILAPETIGVIAYLAKHGEKMKAYTDAGYVMTCVGTNAPPTYKRSRKENSVADKVAERVLRKNTTTHYVIPFAIGGSDERQYCSPGFDLPVGSLIRSMYQSYPEYHTSLDNKSLISFEAMEKTVDLYFAIVRDLESRQVYERTNAYCEPRLGKYGLYPETGGTWQVDLDFTRKVLHILAHCDGKTDLEDIAEKYGASVEDLEPVVQRLVETGLLKAC